MTENAGKYVRESALEREYQVLSSDMNNIGVLYGGRLVAIIDSLAARVARQHSGLICVTASIDSMNFLAPVLEDETLIIKASVNHVWTSSMELGVKVLVKRKESVAHVASAYLTFVALDKAGKPTRVSPVIPETEDEQRRYQDADIRRQVRLANRHRKNEGP